MSLLNRAHAITRHIYKNQLFDWIMAITKAIAGSPALIGVGPYATVARAAPPGGVRMLDEDAGLLAGIENGAAVWTESFKAVWYWRTDFPAATVTDNETTCRPTAWIATALPGAFVRDVSGDAMARRQTAWFVDSTAADNEGLGAALDPLQTDIEIGRRWGPAAALSQPTSITYVQSPAAPTNLDVQLLPGGSLKLLGVSTTTAPAVISAVTVQNRATPQGWQITAPGLGIANVGQIVELSASVTPGNIGAYATILAEIVPGTVLVTPFGVATIAFPPFANVTPVAGDSVIVRTLPTLLVGAITFRADSLSAPTATPTNCAVVDLLNLQGTSSFLVGHGLKTLGVSVFLQRTVSASLRTMSLGAAGGFFQAGGGFRTATSTFIGSMLCYSTGFLASVSPPFNGALSLLQDCYFQAAGITVQARAGVTSFGAGFFNRTTTALTVDIGGVYVQAGAVPDWGSTAAAYAIAAKSGATYSYSTKPTINSGLGAGRETIVGGTDKLLTLLPYLEGANGAAIVLTS